MTYSALCRADREAGCTSVSRSFCLESRLLQEEERGLADPCKRLLTVRPGHRRFAKTSAGVRLCRAGQAKLPHESALYLCKAQSPPSFVVTYFDVIPRTCARRLLPTRSLTWLASAFLSPPSSNVIRQSSPAAYTVRGVALMPCTKM